MKLTNLRLYHLERAHNMNLQYGRRDTVEITGIPVDLPDKVLEDEVIEIFKEAKVFVALRVILAKRSEVFKVLYIVSIFSRKFV